MSLDGFLRGLGDVFRREVVLHQQLVVLLGGRAEAVHDAHAEGLDAAVGGAGALLSKVIKASEVIAYDDLGTEAIRKMQVEDFPAIVVIDCEGNDLYLEAAAAYRKEK